ncbi:MAG: hypothetical protein CL868_09070 [Cytophagaceae bacterium]|nr:hypothetical protein [Cytophagaceae bacterium]
MKHLFTTVVMCCSLVAFAQSEKQKDIQSIKDMCGCYEVTFKYTETFSPEIDYEKHLDYTAAGLEWAGLVEDGDNKISIQHILVVQDTMIIKHWRQDWTYEDNSVFYYDKNNSWNFKKDTVDVAGTWTQKVFQVDDSPRYSGIATWIHKDGRDYWENYTDSPLPRREYSKRDDYNVMRRGNHVEITPGGWVHEQDNDKIIRDEDGDQLLAQEKGYNVYTKVPDERCQAAATWWKENEGKWAEVRDVWTDVYNREGKLTLKKAVDEQPLFMHLFPMETTAGKEAYSKIIHEFIEE